MLDIIENRSRLEAKKDKWNKEKAEKNNDTREYLANRQAELQKAEDFYNSRRGQINSKLNGFLRETSAEKDILIKSFINFSVEIKYEIVNFIKSELKYDEKSKDSISFEQIEEIVNHLLKVFKKVKSISADSNIKKQGDPRAYSNYDNLLIELIKLDSRFILFASKRVIEKAESAKKITKLPEDLKKRMVIRLKKLKANEKWDYIAEKHVALTPNGKREKEINSLMNKIATKEADIISRYNKSLKALSNNIFEVLKNDISENGINNQEELEEYVNLFHILTLRDICKNEKIKNLNVFTPYESLFNKLIDLDARFALYAPVKSIKNCDNDFSELSKEERKVIKDKLKKETETEIKSI